MGSAHAKRTGTGQDTETARTAFTVRVPDERRYEVLFEPGLCARYGTLLRELDATDLVVLTDKRVYRLYGEPFLASLREAGFEPKLIVIPDGERSKSMETFARLLDRLAELECDRRAVLVNFGGGVISDLGGFVASAYMRGIRYANFATSLLGQVDACVGGKVAVNSRHAKNLIGAFHHPSHAAGDPELLATLSDRDFRSGLAEAIKVAILDGSELFEFLERDREAIRAREPAALTHVVGEGARVKMDMIARDPYEADLRRPLNFGHTIGHPIETEFGYRGIRHGEAVAIGMGVATAIALHRGLIERDDADRILDLLQAYDLLGYDEPIRPDAVVEHVRYVRLIRGKKLHFVLPTRIGAVQITDALENGDLVRGFEHYERIVQERLA